MNKWSWRHGSVLAVAAGHLALPSTLLAQAAGSSAQGTAAERQDEPPADDTAVTTVVVTGSRIQRKDYVAESPIVTVGETAIKNSGTPALDQTLNQLPQFTGSATGQSPTATTGQARSAGRATANLRGLGAPRTLVLLDGRRLQPSDSFNVVDLNTIPAALIQNVEVITGGASAVYGSDAVAGVVNFKLNPNFEGLQLDADVTESSKGDGRVLSSAVTLGSNFADGRGNAVLSGSYFKRDEIFRSSRRFFDQINGASQGSAGMMAASGTNLVSASALSALFRGKYGLSTQPTTGANLSVNPDGSLYGNLGALNFQPQDQYFINPANNTVQFKRDLTLQSPLERASVLAKANLRFNRFVEAYGQLLFTNYQTEQNTVGVNSSDAQTIVPVTNPFVPNDLRTLLASRPDPNAPFVYFSNTARVSPLSFRQDNTLYQPMIGARGDLNIKDWTWDAYASHGRTTSVQTSIGYVSRAAFRNLAFAPDGGASICAGGYPLFTTAALSPACQNYLSRSTSGQDVFEQDVVEASVQGALFSLPAGEVRFAAGADHRVNKYKSTPDAQFSNDELLGGVVTQAASGKQSVSEVYGEVFIPILQDVTLAKSLSADLAYRYSDYDTSGGVSTYKASGEWKVWNPLLIRGGYQRAIRAPSVGELFSGLRSGSTTIGTPAQGGGDPCDFRSIYRTGANGAAVRNLCLAQGLPAGLIDTFATSGTVVGSRQTGNPGLVPEVADSYTLGFVLRPDFAFEPLSDLSVSVDYYTIDISGAIGTLTGTTSLQNCYNATGGNPTYDINNPFCQNILRTAGGAINYLTEASANLARYQTSGVDTQIDWVLEAQSLGLSDSLGSLSTNLVVSYVDGYKIQTISGGPFLDYSGTIGNNAIDLESLSHPQWRVTASLTYARGPLQLGVRYRDIGKMSNSANVGTATVAPGVKAVSYFDLNGRYALSSDLELRAGVLNVADKQPPVWTGQSATDPSTYDLVGRRFFVGLTSRFQ